MKLVKDLRGHLHLKDMLTGKRKKVVAMLSLTMIMSMMFCTVAFADTSTTTDWSPITTALNGKLTVAEIMALIAAIIGGSYAAYLAWWGARKLTHAITVAFSKGKIHF